jgi:uncharacterized protein (DUF983 family)
MSPPHPPKRKREIARAVLRGLRGRRPQCGQGRLIAGYIAPVSMCSICGEVLSPYQSADFAPYLVVFVVGLVFTPLVVLLSLSSRGNGGVVVITAAALASALAPARQGRSDCFALGSRHSIQSVARAVGAHLRRLLSERDLERGCGPHHHNFSSNVCNREHCHWSLELGM